MSDSNFGGLATAITSVVPVSKPRTHTKTDVSQLAARTTSAVHYGASVVTAPKVNHRGRKAIILKNGKPLAEARAEAKAALKAVKIELRLGRIMAKDAARRCAAATKTGEKLAKAQATAELGLVSKPKDAVAKAAVKQAKERVKQHNAAIRAASKTLADATKAVTRQELAVGKAVAAQLKIEEAKLKLLN